MLTPRIKSILTTGIAIFSMFFGAGNIFLPILVGKQTVFDWPFGFFGFFVTAVIVPFLGLLGITLTCGDKREFFRELPDPVYFALITLLLSIMALGAMPRIILTAFGGVAQLLPTLHQSVFALIFCILIVLMILDENNVVGIIGKFLGPIKLGSILFITATALYFGPSMIPSISEAAPMTFGFFQGYQTMDLTASFFFSAAVYRYIKGHIECEINSSTVCQKEIFFRSLMACIVGAVLMAVLYMAFSLLGAKFSVTLGNLAPNMFFPKIADVALGKFAVLTLAITLLFACLATSVIIAELYVEFLHENVFRMRISRNICILITMGTAYLITLIGFVHILKFWGYILTFVYPLLIAFTVYKLFVLLVKRRCYLKA